VFIRLNTLLHKQSLACWARKNQQKFANSGSIEHFTPCFHRFWFGGREPPIVKTRSSLSVPTANLFMNKKLNPLRTELELFASLHSTLAQV
jgi:hypothetical protein